MSKETTKPNPGSPEAVDIGCTCPRMDNSYGRGYMGGVKDPEGNTVFVIAQGCPIHNMRNEHEN